MLSSIWEVNDKQVWAARRNFFECRLNIVIFYSFISELQNL